ncbi:hypothetical protein CHARACLAT_014285 [Characodon lateralis]|uniref:Uncharacterized protein n=1 Tax=Characodon lateralis TaxID=208331 RepID=A0ABU7E0F7_9TELE|nr:hypothetical protein [Characodon lateralis]
MKTETWLGAEETTRKSTTLCSGANPEICGQGDIRRGKAEQENPRGRNEIKNRQAGKDRVAGAADSVETPRRLSPQTPPPAPPEVSQASQET